MGETPGSGRSGAAEGGSPRGAGLPAWAWGWGWGGCCLEFLGAEGSSFIKGVPWGWRVRDAGAGRGVTGSCPGPRSPPGTPTVQRGPGPLAAVCHTRARASAEEEGGALGASGPPRSDWQARGQGRPQVQHEPKPLPALTEEGGFGRVRGSTGWKMSSDPRGLGVSGEGRRLLPGGTREPQKVFAGGMLAVLAEDKFSEFGLKKKKRLVSAGQPWLRSQKSCLPKERGGGRIGLLTQGQGAAHVTGERGGRGQGRGGGGGEERGRGDRSSPSK